MGTGWHVKMHRLAWRILALLYSLVASEAATSYRMDDRFGCKSSIIWYQPNRSTTRGAPAKKLIQKEKALGVPKT